MYLWYSLRPTYIATKPWLSGNMLPNIKICENGWSNFKENLRLDGIKIARVNPIRITNSINLLLFCTVLRSAVIEGDFPCTVHLHKEVYAVYYKNSSGIVIMLDLKYVENCTHVCFRFAAAIIGLNFKALNQYHCM